MPVGLIQCRLAARGARTGAAPAGGLEPLAAPRPCRRAPPRAAELARRRIGRTNIEVVLLCIAGANGCAPAALAQARYQCVNLFFWEPCYAELTRFFASSSSGTATWWWRRGTSMPTVRGIERHVEFALRRLRRPQIDLFLLFFRAVSPERLAVRRPSRRCSGSSGGAPFRAAAFSTHHPRAGGRCPGPARVGTGHALRQSAVGSGRGAGAAARGGACWHRGARPSAPCALGACCVPTASLLLPTAAHCYRYSPGPAGGGGVHQRAASSTVSWSRTCRFLTAPTLTAACGSRAAGPGRAGSYAQAPRFNTLAAAGARADLPPAATTAGWRFITPTVLTRRPAGAELSDPWSSRCAAACTR